MEENKVVTLIDEEGKEQKFEVIMDFKVNENEYAALLPIENQNEGVLLFRVIEEKDGLTFKGIPDKEEYEIVAKAYNELI